MICESNGHERGNCMRCHGYYDTRGPAAFDGHVDPDADRDSGGGQCGYCNRFDRSLVRCSCHRSYTPDEWERLPFAGLLGTEGVTIELRNCSCGSTMGRTLGPVPAWWIEEERKDAA